MKFNQLKVNSEIEYFGKNYTVWSINSPYIEIKRSSGDGEMLTITFFELVQNPSFKASSAFVKKGDVDEIKFKSELDALKDKKKDKVLEKYELIRPILILRKAKSHDIRSAFEFAEFYKEYLENGETIYDINQKELLSRISKKKTIGKRTLKRYLSLYNKAEYEVDGHGQDGLISDGGIGYTKRNDNKKLIICHHNDPSWVLDELDVRLEEKYLPILKFVIENEYLTTKKITKAAAYWVIKALCTKEGITPLSRRTIEKLLGRINEQVKVRMREGKAAFEKYTEVTRGFSNEGALYPLHIVEIDHTLMDMDVIDEKTGYNIGRPWITLGIDVFSRMPWCLYISLEPPSANRVRKALEHGVLLKRSKEKYKTINEWVVYGKPTIIYLDNGPDFKSVNVKRMIMETLQTNVMYRPVKTPKYGATIERLFGKLNSELIHSLNGTRKSHFYNLGDYNPEKEAILTISDLTEILTLYFTDIYPYKPNRGLPLDANTPIVRYLDGIKNTGYPDFIPTEDEERFKMELLPTTMKPHTRDGIRLENVYYRAEGLSKYIATKNVMYKIKYDVDDISRIFFLPPDSSEYIEVPAINPPAESIKGMNRYKYKKIREIMQADSAEKLGNIPGAADVERCEEILYENITKKYTKNKTIRKQTNLADIDLSKLMQENQKNSKVKISFKDLIENALVAEVERSID